MTPLIVVDELCIGYQNARGERLHVLRDVSLAVHKGETLGVVGESGCGKSTLILALMGFLRRGSALISGAVRFDGSDLFALDEAALAKVRGGRIAIIPQNAGQALTPSIRVGAQIAEALQLHTALRRAAAAERVTALLDQVRLGESYLTRYPAQLSGGEKQRIAIARAFAADPDIVLCDEITSALDVSVQAAVLELLAALQQERGTAYIFIAHDLAVVRAIADRVIVMHRGRICQMGTTAEVYHPPHHPYTEALLSAAHDIHLDGSDMPDRAASFSFVNSLKREL